MTTNVIMTSAWRIFLSLLEMTFFTLDQALEITKAMFGFPFYYLRNNKMPKKRKRVVIIGAGFAGLTAQRTICEYGDEFDVTVIDMKNYFEYTPGILRSFVNPKHITRLTGKIPSKRNKFIFGEVIGFKRGEPTGELTVKLIDKSTGATKRTSNDVEEVIHVPYDYLLIGSGSSYEQPIKPQKYETTLQIRKKTIESEYNKIQKAKAILIIGGGPVGVELAGEILTQFPNKNVIITDMAKTICPSFPKASVDYMTSWLIEHNCELILGTPIGGTFPNGLLIDENGCTLSNDQRINADLVYKCMGFKATAEFMKTDLGTKHFKGNSLIVDDQLRVLETSNVFGMGDCMIHSKSNDIKLGHTAEINAHLVVENIVRLSNNEKLLSYPEGVVNNNHVPHIYCVSLGEFDGSLCFNNFIINGKIAALMKHILEVSKVAACNERIAGKLFWQLADLSSIYISKYLFTTSSAQDKEKLKSKI